MEQLGNQQQAAKNAIKYTIKTPSSFLKQRNVCNGQRVQLMDRAGAVCVRRRKRWEKNNQKLRVVGRGGGGGKKIKKTRGRERDFKKGGDKKKKLKKYKKKGKKNKKWGEENTEETHGKANVLSEGCENT